jgi:copper chaperone
MTTTTATTPATIALKVEGMTCQHCARAVTGAIQGQDPAAQVQVDLGAGTVHAVTILPPDQVAAAVAEEGYKVVG